MSAISVPYLGMPSLSMRALPSPRPGSSAPPTLYDAASTSLGGTTTVFRNIYPRRTFNLNYSNIAAVDADQLLNFYQGLYGLGPFAFVDPSARNMLPFDIASCGARSYAAHGWVASAGTLAAAATGAPTAVADSGVLTWTTPTASATLQPGAAANVADILAAAPYLASEAVTVSAWVWNASSKSVSLQLVGYTSAGVVMSSSIVSTATIGTTFTQLTVSAAANAAALAGAVFVGPRIVMGASAPTSTKIAGVQLEFGSAATAWQAGFGVPRVVITSSPGRDLPLIGRSDHTLVLAE